MRPAFAILAVLLATTSATAAPHVLRDGANHHLGDDSFIARFGRAPTDADGEPLRMRVHLEHVHAQLAAAPATSPALAGRRAELLGYLGEYIAKGTTPENTYVPWRNPVFIDARGNICAVGYLIERSVGRAVPEAIANTHRLDYLEDIAAERPEVAAWVAASGFTLDELASIQPGYPGPDVMHLMGWLTRKTDPEARGDQDGWQELLGEALPADGPYRLQGADGAVFTGTFAKGQMVGEWTRKLEGKVLGRGTFRRGAATWESFHPDGSRLAVGPFVKSHAHGAWKVFHPSGRLAAAGALRDGQRHGTWTFFYDNAANSKLAVGAFRAGHTVGDWKHFDEQGALVAKVSGAAWAGITLALAPNAAGVRHEVHQGIPAERDRLDGLYRGTDTLYVREDGAIFDGGSNQLEKTQTGWVARACKWTKQRKAAARARNASLLHELMLKEMWRNGEHVTYPCDGKPVTVPAAQVKRYEQMIASRWLRLAPIPVWSFARQPVIEDEDDTLPVNDEDDADDDALGGADNPLDFATYLTRHATWYMEWPHVDDTFRAVYRSLPGYAVEDTFPIE